MLYCTTNFFAFPVVNKRPAHCCCCRFYNSSHLFQNYLSKIFHKVNCIRSPISFIVIVLGESILKTFTPLLAKLTALQACCTAFIFWIFYFLLDWIPSLQGLMFLSFFYLFLFQKIKLQYFLGKKMMRWQRCDPESCQCAWPLIHTGPTQTDYHLPGELCSHRAFPSPSSCDSRA